MRLLWTLVKVMVGLAIAIPVGLALMALAFGTFAVLIGLLTLAVRIAVFGLVGYGVYRLARAFFAPDRGPAPAASLPSPDPYYAAAMRELDAEIGR